MASSNKPTSKPGILLLEQYTALAAAIVSALKTFAPGHATAAAGSIDEAEKLASNLRPDLFIIDFAPSYEHLPKFLEKMRKAHPQARALVLASDVPQEIAVDRKEFGVLQFIKKPYEVAEFGSAVRALITPASAARSSLRVITLADIVALQCSGGRSVVVDAKGEGGSVGVIHLIEGKIFHAETDEQHGVKALKEMFAWRSPRWWVTEKVVRTPRTIRRPWPAAFMEASSRSKLTEKKPVEKPKPKAGKKIVIVDDTEMLLIFAEDSLSTADPQLQITKAATGTDGLQQIQHILPDLVLLDYSLPDVNGDEVCRRLLENEHTAHIPVVMMSAHGPEMAAAATQFANIVATLEKPFLSEALVDVGRRVLAAGPRPAPVPPIPQALPPEAVVSPEPEQQSRAAASEPFSAPEPQPSTKPQELATKPPSQEPLPPAAVQVQPRMQRAQPVEPPSRTPAVSGPVPAVGPREVVLGLVLKVMSMQLTPQLRLGAIRARPVSFTVSLRFPPGTPQDAIQSETGFQLGTTQLDNTGRISGLCLIPSGKPVQPADIRNEFEIGGVTIIPSDTRARVQLTPAGTTPMTMELLARMDMAGVELSPTFQVAQLTLKWRTTLVRIMLNPKAPEQSGAVFEAAAVKLDKFGRIAELLLNPMHVIPTEVEESRRATIK